MTARGRWRLAAALAAAVPLACGGGAAPARAPFVAVWLAESSQPPTRAGLTRLAAAGALELFLEAGRLRLAGDMPRLEPIALRPLPREAQTTLVVRGTWSTPPASSRAIAESWLGGLDALLRAAREAGATPIGLHFDLALESGGEELAAVLRRLRRELRGRLFVSLALPAAELPPKAASALAAAVDFVAADLYGQPPGESDQAGRWDLAATRAGVGRMESLGVRYAAVAWTLGRAELRSRAGGATALGGGVPLARMLRSPAFAPRPGAVFAGVDRQVFELEAREPGAFGPWTLARGDVVRVTRPTTRDLEKLLATLVASGGERRIGLVLRQLPPPGDTISASAGNLAAALEPGDATPAFEVSLVRSAARRGRRGGVPVRVVLSNRNEEATELGGGEWNFVQLEFERGSLGRVAPGDFAGWEQFWLGRERRTLRALREADTLRLFVPYVGAGETISSGEIELRAPPEASPEVRVSGRFLLPGGRELVLASAPARWIEDGGEERSE